MFAIEKSIPMPESQAPRRGRPSGQSKYPFKQLEIGDSFAVPIHANEKSQLVQRRLCVSARKAAKLLGSKFATRVNGQAVRVWRIA